jgi:hypothetical protein
MKPGSMSEVQAGRLWASTDIVGRVRQFWQSKGPIGDVCTPCLLNQIAGVRDPGIACTLWWEVLVLIHEHHVQ